MTPDLRRIYWDANTFLDELNPDSTHSRRLTELLSRSTAGELEIITSNLTIVEVAFSPAEAAARALDPEEDARIRARWTDPQTVTITPFNDAIALNARSLMRAALAIGAGLKPADAVHLATAVWAEADVLHTYDRRLQSAARRLQVIAVEEP